MKNNKGEEILRIAPKNNWMRLDYLERQIKGKILVDEAELRKRLNDAYTIGMTDRPVSIRELLGE